MILLLDLGNTRLKFALYKAETLFMEGQLNDLQPLSISSIPHFEEVENIIMSSVVYLPQASQDLIEPRLIKTKPKLHSKTYHVDSLGEDRKYLALGAGANCLVICLGTCITYNLINAENEFIAGAISPGLQIRAKAMAEGTANLPEVKIQNSFEHWGVDTESNLLAGIMGGVEFEIKGFISNIYKELHDIRIILTGGDAHHYSHLFPVDEHLLWKGMLQVMK